MLTDTEIKKEGLKILIEKLGDLNAEKFISLIIKEPFDYTKWQSMLWKGQTVGQISKSAMDYRLKNKK